MSRVVVLCGVLAACADVPERGFESSLVVTTASDGTHVKSPVFELVFAATGAKLPSHLYTAAGVDVLGTDPACGAQSLIGFAAAPAVTVDGGAPVASSELQITAAGPAIVKAHVTFAAPYSCPDATQLSGSADFTIFPSGRIVREDNDLQATTQSLAPSASCGCATAQQNFSFSTYWAFAAAGATQMQPDGSPVSPGVTQACTMYSDHGVAVSFLGGGSTSSDVHLGAVASHVLYWTENASSLEPGMQSMISAINLGPAGQSCDEMMRPLYDEALDVGETSLENTGRDGIFRDDIAVHSSAFVVKTATVVPPGWALSVDLGGADHAAITRSPDLGTNVAVSQREQGTRYLFFFPDALTAGETITITPQ